MHYGGSRPANPTTSATTGWPVLRDLDLDDYDALVVCGGQAPVFPFREHADLKAAIARFYEARKPTAALCQGVSSLIDIELSDGSLLVDGKTVTGFANVEEDFSDAAVGTKVVPSGKKVAELVIEALGD